LMLGFLVLRKKHLDFAGQMATLIMILYFGQRKHFFQSLTL